MTAPLVSVCVPIYNGLPFVLETISSVRRQTFGDWELVLTENGSRDGSPEAVRALLERDPDPRIRYYPYDAPTGLPADWNRAVRHARGVFVKVLPCDDRLDEDCLRQQVQALRDDEALGFVSCARRIIDASGKTRLQGPPRRKDRYFSPRDARRVLLAGGQNLVGEPGCGLMRRELFEALGGYDERFHYYPDLDLWIRALQRRPALALRQRLCDFRIHSGGQSAALRARYVDEYRLLLAEHASASSVSFVEQNVALARARGVALGRSLVIRWLMNRASSHALGQ